MMAGLQRRNKSEAQGINQKTPRGPKSGGVCSSNCSLRRLAARSPMLRGLLRDVHLEFARLIRRRLSFGRLVRSRFGAGEGLLLGQLACIVPPTPLADERALGVLADGRLLAIIVPPNPGAFGNIGFVLTGGRDLAVLMPEGERTGSLAVFIRTFHLWLAVGIP